MPRAAVIRDSHQVEARESRLAPQLAFEFLPPAVFISYSHQDEAWKDQLVAHLAGLKQDGRLVAWNDRRLQGGEERLRALAAVTEDVRVAVFLLSPDFLASAFIQNHEVFHLLERQLQERTYVLPVIVKDCSCPSRVTALVGWPRNPRALETFRGPGRDAELKRIAQEILQVLHGRSLPISAGPGFTGGPEAELMDEASLCRVCDFLPDELAGRWRTLSVFPADFDAYAAAAVWVVDQDDAEQCLAALVRRHLVARDHNRYRLDDLARVFADRRCGAEERTEAQRRHAVHYRFALDWAHRLHLAGDLDLPHGLGWVDLEWDNLCAGQAWAADHLAEPGAAELAWAYPHAGLHFFLLRLHPTEWIGWLETALRAARQLPGRRHWEGDALGNLGIAWAARGESHRAIELYEQQLALTREIGDRRGESRACWNLGRTLEELGELACAVEVMQLCVDYEREAGDPEAEQDAAWVENLRCRDQPGD